jgi:hypothetical protein
MEKLTNYVDSNIPIQLLFAKKIYHDNIDKEIIRFNVVSVDFYETMNYPVMAYYRPISKMFQRIVIEDKPIINVL